MNLGKIMGQTSGGSAGQPLRFNLRLGACPDRKKIIGFALYQISS
jgi:hypothetical protein